MIELEIVWLTGILGGILFILNFATCTAMPWATKIFSKGSKPLCANHKPLAVLTVIAGIIHIVISILWYFGY